jgi:photosystem II stability/assembly factor-like uncharacterized protein
MAVVEGRGQQPSPKGRREDRPRRRPSAHAFDDLDELVQFVAVSAGKMDELPRSDDDLSVRRSRRNCDSASAPKLEQPLVAELSERAQDRVRVDAQHRRQVTCRRESIAGLGLSLCDRPTYLAGDLLVKIDGLVAVELDMKHGASNTSVIGGHEMSVITPRPPSFDEVPEAEALEALIEEARRRARRRRRGYAACALVAFAVTLLAYFGFDGGRGHSEARPEPGPEVGTSPVASPAISGGAARLGTSGITSLVQDTGHPETLYAGTLDAGLFKSSNGGRRWHPLNLDTDATRVDALALDPGDAETVYAGTGLGVFKSTDGGASWNAANTGLFGNETAQERAREHQHRLLEGYVYGLAVNPRHPATVYASTWEHGLLKSTNGGATWSSVGFKVVMAVALDPRNPEIIYAGAFAGGQARQSGLFRSGDGGLSWHPAGLAGQNVISVAVDPRDSGLVYAGTDRGAFVTTDGARTWRAAGLEEERIHALAFDPRDGRTVYAGTYPRGIFRSSDGGASWQQTLSGGAGVTALALSPQTPATLYAASIARGVLKSTNGGRWQAVNAGLTTARVSSVMVDPKDVRIVYVGDDGGGVFKRSSDGTWQAANIGLKDLGVHALAIESKHHANLYAGTDRGVFKSTDGGASWSASLTAPFSEGTVVSALAIDPRSPNTVYAVSADESTHYASGSARFYLSRIFKSTDRGERWRAVGTVQKLSVNARPGAIIRQTVFMSPLALDLAHSRILYAGGRGVLKSIDGGANWQPSGLAHSTVYALELDPETSTTLYAGTDKGLFMSTNGGASWHRSPAPLQDAPVKAVAIDREQPLTVYAGTDGGVFRSTDGGHTWHPFGGQLPLRPFDALAIDRAVGKLYVGALGGGIFELGLAR